MATYRSGTNWGNATWPGATETPDNTAWVFDEASGLVTSKRYADGSSESFTYSVNGKTLTHTLARSSVGSHVVTFSYDSATGDKLGIDYSDSTPDVTFTYNRLGRKITVSDAVGGRGFAYNSAFQLESETITNALAGTTNVLSYGYATNGLAGRNLGFDLDSDYAISYAHDSYGRLNLLTFDLGPSTGEVAYSYLSNSDLITVMTNSTYGFSSVKTYENSRDLITSVENTFGTNLISRYEYGNDVLGRRTERVDSGSAISAGSTNVFGYNSRSELTSALMGTNGSAFSYDPIGNRQSVTNNADGTVAYSANELNQYTEVAGTTTNLPTYDADGNTTNDGTYAYTWNCANRLLEVEPLSPDTNSYKVAFTYDYMGRRCSKDAYGFDGTNWNGTADESRCFVYDGYNLISESIVTSGSTNDRFYVFGLDLSGSLQGAGGIGGLLATIQDDGVFFPSFDANGNICQYADTNGTVVASREYSAYGETISSSGAMADDFTFWFSTKYWDSETGFGYWGRRYYHPEQGRWLSRDPIREDGGMNIYAFVLNAPIDLSDTYGEGLFGSNREAEDDNGKHLIYKIFKEGNEELIEIVVEKGVLSANRRKAAKKALLKSLKLARSVVEDVSATGGLDQFPPSIGQHLGDAVNEVGDTVPINKALVMAGVEGLQGALDIYAYIEWSKGAEIEMFEDLVQATRFYKNVSTAGNCDAVCEAGMAYVNSMPGEYSTGIMMFWSKYCTGKCCDNHSGF